MSDCSGRDGDTCADPEDLSTGISIQSCYARTRFKRRKLDEGLSVPLNCWLPSGWWGEPQVTGSVVLDIFEEHFFIYYNVQTCMAMIASIINKQVTMKFVIQILSEQFNKVTCRVHFHLGSWTEQ